MEQLPEYISNFELLKKIEALYGSYEDRIDILRFGKVSPTAEKTLQFLKDKMYIKILARYTDALLFIEYSINNELKIKFPMEICKIAKLMNEDINQIMSKIKGKSFYSEISSSFASRHFHKICLLDPDNRKEILGGLSFISIGLVALSLGAIKIFKGAYF